MIRSWSRAAIAIVLAIVAMAPESTVLASRPRVRPHEAISASSILARSYAADERLGTAHGVGSSIIVRHFKVKSAQEAVTDTGVFSGNATTTSSNHSMIQEALSTKAHGSVESGALDYVTIGSRMADRPNASSAWRCFKTSYLNKIDVWTPVSFGILLKHEGGQLKITGSQNLNGDEAWVVKQTMTTRVGKVQVHESSSYVVDKKTYALLQFTDTQTATPNGEPWSEVNNAAFNHYGKPLKIHMPSCK